MKPSAFVHYRHQLSESVICRPGDTLASVEKRLILATLSVCDNSKPKAAKVLGTSLKTLYNLLNQWDAEGNK